MIEKVGRPGEAFLKLVVEVVYMQIGKRTRVSDLDEKSCVSCIAMRGCIYMAELVVTN